MSQTVLLDGSPGQSFKLTADADTVFTIPTDKINLNGVPPIGALIVCESKSARICFGGAVPSRDTGLGMILSPGDSLVFRNPLWLRTLKATNLTAGENFTLQITMEY